MGNTEHELNEESCSTGGLEMCRPRNWLVPVILLTLREWNSYGYELMERAAAFGFEAMNPGTLYRTLRQMEKEGLCVSKWETSKGGPARRVYSITDAGEAYLDFWARSLEQYQQTIDTFFRLYRRQSATKDEYKTMSSADHLGTWTMSESAVANRKEVAADESQQA